LVSCLSSNEARKVSSREVRGGIITVAREEAR
jgi:hypothetical protein